FRPRPKDTGLLVEDDHLVRPAPARMMMMTLSAGAERRVLIQLGRHHLVVTVTACLRDRLRRDGDQCRNEQRAITVLHDSLSPLRFLLANVVHRRKASRVPARHNDTQSLT